MSSTINIAYGTLATLTFSGLNSLSNQTLAVSSAVDNSAASVFAVDYLVEVVIADVSESGNKQVLVFAESSLDGTNYSDPNVSNLARLGFLDITGTGPQRSRAFSLAAAFNGSVPLKFKIAIFNDAGVALASSGNSASVLPIFYTAT